MSHKQKVTCTRKIHFSAGHRVMGHENKCATAHGHNYYAHLFAEGESLDNIGRIIDFSVIKEKIGGWINENWDHTFLVWERDTQTIDALMSIPRNQDPFICPFNPTAENMALYLLHEVCPKLLKDSGVIITKVILYETDNCYATAEIT
ncbi:MAG: 6-carboxytetrahydropterin synthase [Chlamydiota bacterium]|nr:6-carboxytetrahydropterin synthase [Chlamydiota bacterium]